MVKEREAWNAAVLGVTKTWTELTDLTTTTNTTSSAIILLPYDIIRGLPTIIL